MSLLNSYGSSNRVVEEDLAITYTKARVYGHWETTAGAVVTTHDWVWQYTRTASKTYRYVGMTRTAANTCATAMRTLYQRTTKVSDWYPADDEFFDVTGGEQPMADVAVCYVAGGMYETRITVHETDTKMRVASVSPETLFALENARTYDTN